MSVLTANGVPTVDARGYLRPVNVRRDLSAIADLVELCFSDSLDPDGRSYLQQMRAASRASQLFDWFLNPAEQPESFPITGYVWEVDGRIVGNLSLIHFMHQKRALYLIANVAVHPEYRQRGIARKLTAAGLGYIQRRGVSSAWLHVRDDNPAAIHIYEALGFTEQARRTTWHSQPQFLESAIPPQFQIGPRQPGDWSQQREWLARLYPVELSWHLTIDWQALGPGWLNAFYRFFTFSHPRHWVVRSQGKMLAAVSWLRSDTYTDSLYLAAPPNCAPITLQALLSHARHHIPRAIPISLNCPSGLAPEAIQAAGFRKNQTLLWMEKKIAV